MEKTTIKQVETKLAAQLKKGCNDLLTDKQCLIAAYLILDYTVNDIAKLLCRSKNTIKMHIRNMKKKCHCETQTRFGAVLQSFIKNNPEGYGQDNSRN